jgi:hypothetical protein
LSDANDGLEKVRIAKIALQDDRRAIFAEIARIRSEAGSSAGPRTRGACVRDRLSSIMAQDSGTGATARDRIRFLERREQRLADTIADLDRLSADVNAWIGHHAGTPATRHARSTKAAESG